MGAVSNSDTLWHRTLLCADGTVILILVNHDFTSDVGGFSSTPLKDVQLDLLMPPWGHHEAALVVDGNGIRELKFSTNGDSGAKTVYLAELATAELIVIGDTAVSTALGRRFRELQDLANQRTRQLSAALEAESEKLNRKRAVLRERGILLESGCEIGDGRDLADWREEGAWPRISHPDREEKRSGNYSLRIVARNQYSIPVDIPAGVTCRLEFYVKFSEISATERIQAAIEYLDEKGNIVDTRSVTETGTSSDWKFVMFESIAPPRASYAQIRFHKESGTGSAWVDDVRLVDASNRARQ